VDRLTPVEVSGLESGVTALVAGDWHTCALTASGGVTCWGWNEHGQLGDGTHNTRLTPTPVSGLASGVTALAAGFGHTCALTASGGVMCWGDNGAGQLGDGTIRQRSIPAEVSSLASGAAALAAGMYDHTCAVAAGGGAMCWGDNEYGQLGDGTITDRNIPALVSGLESGVTALAAGAAHTCALTPGGGVLCWGNNTAGQLGDGTTADRWAPVAVNSLESGVMALAAGGSHTCAVTASGGVLCWGSNWAGQLGDGTTEQKLTPVPVSGLGSGVTALAAGGAYTCALTAGGGVLCWGYNGGGELGDGTTENRLTPVPVSGLESGVTALAAGWSHTCAVTAGAAGCCAGEIMGLVNWEMAQSSNASRRCR
jgi:alpha-tubulin suppressor-like RCC1 family protein